jgi:ATP-dependent DNA helicase RecG
MPNSERRPHASIPRNPLLAGPLFLAGYIEQAGTGTLDMIAFCRDAGLKAPGFRQDGGSFVQTLWRPAPYAIGQATAQVTEQATAQDHNLSQRLIDEAPRLFPLATAQVTVQVTAQAALFCQEPRSARELMDHLGLRHWKTFQTNYLVPLIQGEVLEMTIPDKPTSPNQKYRLTAKGRAWLIEKGN